MRKRAVLLAGGAMYALFAAFGWQAQTLGESEPIRALRTAAVLFPLAALMLWALFHACDRVGTRAHGTRPFSTKRAFLLMLLCDLPMFVIAFPGSFAYDVPYQLAQVFSGAYSTHHPLLHTLLLGGCVALGRAVGHVNLGAALYTALQVVAMALCFALTCASIGRLRGARAARGSMLFFALYPLHGVFAVNATKDVLFSGLFALMLALSFEEIDSPGASRRRLIGLCACAALSMMLRNNAVYAVVVWLLVLFFALRKRARALVAAVAMAVVLSMSANALLHAATGAQSGSPVEMLSWPIQQLARARLLDGDKMTDAERAAIDAWMPNEAWRLYDPTISDPVKFEFDMAQVLRDPAYFVRVYLSVGAKCPKAYFDALLMHTYSFWYPYSRYRVSGYYVQMTVATYGGMEKFGIHSAFERPLAALSWRLGAQGAMQFPVIGWLFNMGLIMWTMLFFALREAYEGNGRRFVIALLPVLLWGTFLLGPVMAGRYAYPFVCALPAMAGGERR